MKKVTRVILAAPRQMEREAKRHYIQAYGNAVRVHMSRHGSRSFEHIMAHHAIALVDDRQPEIKRDWATQMSQQATAGNVCDTRINNDFNQACHQLLSETDRLLAQRGHNTDEWRNLRRARVLFFNELTNNRGIAVRLSDAWQQYDTAAREMLRLQPAANEDYYWAAADALNKARALGQVMDQEI